MVIADIRFAAPHETDLEAVEELLSAWYKNGQVLEWFTATTQEHVRVLVLLPKPEAVAPQNNNAYAARHVADFAGRGIIPEVRIIGPEPGAPHPCSCQRRSSLVLFTTYLSKASPVRCGDCFGPVPLYELPHVHDHEHLNILHWAADYQACDTLQMHCTTGERFAEAQLARHDSALSRNGLDVASHLATVVNVPVYYFLMKARGVAASKERRRTCPSCGGQWALEAAWHGLFDFKCDSCRLLSNTAYSLSR
jgi:predicted  nucleic acid-binding Zn ribbon protein